MEGADVTIAISDLTVVNILEEPNQFFIDSKMSFKLFKILEESREILSRSVMQQQNKIDNHQLKLY